MELEKKQLHNVCPDGRCPEGIESLKEITLTPQEKRAIFFSIKRKIFDLKIKRVK